MKFRRRADLWGGFLLLVLGAAGIHGALQLDIGSARVMGPGFFPLIASVAIVVCGVFVVGLSVATPQEDVAAPDWGPLASVSGAGIVFGLIVSQAGLIAAILGCILVVAVADRRLTLMTTLFLCLGIGVLAYVTFILFLGLSIPAVRMPRWT